MAVEFNSLNTILDDIMTEIRNNNISESDRISMTQIEQWVHQYRALLIKQDVDKGRQINDQYIQHIYGVQLNKVDIGEPAGLITNSYIKCSYVDVPPTIDFNFQYGWTMISDINGREIQLMSEKRAMAQCNRKFTPRDTVAFKKDGKILFLGAEDLDFINMRGVLETPPSVNSIITASREIAFDYDKPYPIPANMIPTLKNMIFKNEFGIMLNARVDNKNNSSDDTDNDTQMQTK